MCNQVISIFKYKRAGGTQPKDKDIGILMRDGQIIKIVEKGAYKTIAEANRVWTDGEIENFVLDKLHLRALFAISKKVDGASAHCSVFMNGKYYPQPK